jgi:hypothetical protein
MQGRACTLSVSEMSVERRLQFSQFFPGFLRISFAVFVCPEFDGNAGRMARCPYKNRTMEVRSRLARPLRIGSTASAKASVVAPLHAGQLFMRQQREETSMSAYVLTVVRFLLHLALRLTPTGSTSNQTEAELYRQKLRTSELVLREASVLHREMSRHASNGNPRELTWDDPNPFSVRKPIECYYSREAAEEELRCRRIDNCS